MERKTLISVILGATVATIATLSAAFAHINFANANVGTLESQNWMRDIDGEKYLSELSIPGSHDSGALHSIADYAGKCQDVSVKNQLDFGARFLDIRLQLTLGKFKVVHGIVDQKTSFESVYSSCVDFLKYHSGETIIMSIKEEVDAKTDTAFNNALVEFINKDSSFWFTENRIPKLEEVRGKIVLFSRFRNPTIGVKLNNGWKDGGSTDSKCVFDILNEDAIYHIQDHYCLPNVETKWNEVKDTLNYCTSVIDSRIFTLNFVSGYLNNDFPTTYSVPTAKYMNKKVLEEVKNYSRTGTLIFDFVSEELCKEVYGRNK